MLACGRAELVVRKMTVKINVKFMFLVGKIIPNITRLTLDF